MKKCISFFLIFLFSIMTLSAADFYKSTYELASILEVKGEFEEALHEYKRYIFLNDFYKNAEPEYTKQSYEGLIRCYYCLHNFDKALMYARTSGCEELEMNLLMQKSLIYEDWNAFENNFWYTKKAYSDYFTDEEEKTVINAISCYKDFVPKSPRLAAALSVIPGLGQCYAGEYKDALNAFVLDTSLLALSAYSIFNLYFFDFLLLEAGPVFRFYAGNFHNAQKEVKAYNSAKTSEISEPVLRMLKKNLMEKKNKVISKNCSF